MIETEILLGIKLKKVGEAVLTQISSVIAKQDYLFEPRTVPVLFIVNELGPVSVKEIAEILGMTHPAIVQMVSLLTKAGLVSQSKSSNDRRKTLVKLTIKGEKELKKIEPITMAIKDAITSVINSIDSNFIYAFSKFEQVVKSKVIVKTIEEDLRQRKMKDIEIIPYQRKYKVDFAKLNYEWLEKYSHVEEEDKTLLNYPEREIIKKGGEVFFALVNNKAVGTCAVVKVNNNIYLIIELLNFLTLKNDVLLS